MSSHKDLFRLDGRVALVVGAASGIGRSASLGLSDFGALVACADVNLVGAKNTAEEIIERGGRAEFFQMDLLRSESVHEGIHALMARQGRLDIVVATPGINVRKRLIDYTDEEAERVVSLNLIGCVRLLREVGRIMSEAGRGSIILLSSIRSQVVEPGQGVYAATKSGIVQLARTLAAELGPRNVRVNALAPGIVSTPLTSKIRSAPAWNDAYAARNALGRWASADEMIGPILFLASDAASYVTGTVLFADGGWTAIDGRYTPPV